MSTGTDTSAGTSRRARTIIVGDVHGCRAELDALLDKLAFASGDLLIFVGDIVARGPDSRGVLEIARQTGAVLVRGNHEQKILSWRDEKLAGLKPEPLSPFHRDVAEVMTPVDWKLFETSPVAYDLPDHGVYVVHAGLVPGVALDQQKPETMMRIRTVSVPGMRGEQALWGARWAGPPHVVFGHNAAPGLQLHPWATGLDTGCVYGGRLTALVLGPEQKVPRALAARRQLLVSIPARHVWYEPTGRRRAG